MDSGSVLSGWDTQLCLPLEIGDPPQPSKAPQYVLAIVTLTDVLE